MNKADFIIKNVSKTYCENDIKCEVLKDINLELKKGDIFGLLGKSGSGKSTLLNVISLLLPPDSGEIIVEGITYTKNTPKDLLYKLKSKIGIVFQFHHLLPDFTSLENIMLPQLILGKTKKEAKDNALELLFKVGLEEKENYFPSQLSGGERQRVAIARAVVNKPALLIADEPTGNLDPNLTQEVYDLIVEIVKTTNTSCIIATHDVEIIKRLPTKYKLENGILNIYNE